MSAPSIPRRGLSDAEVEVYVAPSTIYAALAEARREGAQAMREAAIAACNAVEDRIAASREGMRRSGTETLTAYQGRRARAVGQAHGAAICAMELAELALPGDAPAQDTTKETDR